MCSNAKRLFRLALGPVLMLLSAVALAARRRGSEPGQYVTWCDRSGRADLRLAHDHPRYLRRIGIGVFGVMFYSIITPQVQGRDEPATFHESTKVEIALDRRALPSS